MSGDQAEQLPKQADLLYLIFKYLETVPGFDATSVALRDNIIATSSLGSAIGWDGNERTADIDDVARNYPNVFSHQLSHLLQHSLSSLSTATNLKPSLLHQMIGVFNPLNASQVKRYSELSKKLVEIISKLRNIKHNTKAANHRIAFLDNALKGFNAVPTIFDEDFMTEDVVPVLQEVGRAKELTHLRSLVVTAESTSSLLNVEINTLTEDMAQLGCLSSGINRGHIDGALGWLQSRELGMTSFGTGSGSALGRALVPSASAMRNKMMSQYRVLYTVSGHMMNPAYCCVFDQTGRYLLTGADDYLVKIWDVEKGQLIKTCKGHMGYISLVAVSPDNSLFASACTMGTIRIWRLSDGLCLQVFKHQAAVNWIKFDRTSCALASASDDGQCIVWDLSKLLPEDGGEVPILDVIFEDRAAALKALDESGPPAKPSREVSQLNMNDVDSEGMTVENDSAAQAATSSSSSSSSVPIRTSSTASSSSSSAGYAPHAGEARLVSAISHSAEVQYVGGGGGGAWNNPAALGVAGSTALHAPIQHFNSRGGLFRWSGCVGADHLEDSDAMLVLHHIQDIMQANSEGDPLKVNCLDVSPMGNILVTGCEDGVARVWRIGDPEPIGAYTTRQPKLPLEGLLQKLKTIVSPSEFSRMKRVAAHLLMRLEGHVSPITDIHLNHLGDRVLTGSAQDCNVRIWSISRDLLKNVQVVLDLTEEEEDSGGADAPQSRVRGGRNNRSRLKSQLYNACWTADSTKIVTIQSVVVGTVIQTESANGGSVSDRLPTRLKVWDAMTGDLLKVIWKISDISCRTLCKHPLNPSVVMTCGDDGIINVWDIDQEERLSSTRLFNDDKTPTKIVDASFSDDGSRLAVTDFLGRLSVLGLDDPERFNKVLTEQYFSTDYLDIMLDNVGFAIDVGTQMPVHEAPIGPLIRLDGTPYDNQPPALKGPPATSKQDIRKMLSEIAVDRKKGLKEMDRVFNTFTRNKVRGRLPKKYRGSKPKALRALEEQNRLREASAASSGPQRSSRIQYIEFDVNNYNPSTDESEDSEFDLRADREARERGEEPDLSRRHNFGQSRQSRRPRIATIQNTSRRSGRARNEVNYEDTQDNNYTARDTVASRAARASGRDAQRRRHQLLNSDEFEDSDETEDSQDSDDIVYDTDNSARPTTRSRRSASVGSDGSRPRRGRSNKRGRSSRVIEYDDEDEGEEEQEQAEVRVRETVARPKKQKPAVFYRAKHGIVLGEGVEVGRKWLQTEESTPQYCPQMGDRVMYFPQGHTQWLQAFPESSSPPWMSFPQKWSVVECEVRGIQYMFPDTPQEHKTCCSVKAQVTLAVVRIPNRNGITNHNQYVLDLVAPRATRHSGAKEITFTVTLRDWDLPDFLIPSDLFLRSIRLAWHAGVRVTTQFKNYSKEEKGYMFTSYEGQIAGISNASPEWPQSPWDCIEVIWDEAAENTGAADVTTDRVGPWEAVPQFSAESEYSRILQKFPLVKIDADEAQRIEEGFDALMTSDEFADLFNPFEFPVDPAAFPSYYLAISVPICVDTLRNRLANGYYRQLEALEFDVNLLYENCRNYNDEGSPIVSAAALLRTEFLKVVRPNGRAVEPAVEEAPTSSSSQAEARLKVDEEPLTLRVRGTGSSSRSSRHQTDSLLGVGLASQGSPPSMRNPRITIAPAAARAPPPAQEETTLRVKRRREPSPEPSPAKSLRSSRSSAPVAEPSRTSRGSRTAASDNTRHVPEARGTRPTRNNDVRPAPVAATSSRSGRGGRAHAQVSYAEVDERDGEDAEDREGDDEDEVEQGSNDDSDEEEGEEEEEDNSSDVDDSEGEDGSDDEGSDEDNARGRTSRHASRSARGREQARTSARSSRSESRTNTRRSSSEAKSSKRDKKAKKQKKDKKKDMKDKKSSKSSRSSRSSTSRPKSKHYDSASGADGSSAEESEEEEDERDTSAAMDREYEKLQQRQQQQRGGRRKTPEATPAAAAHPAQVAHSSRRADPEVKKRMLQVLDFAAKTDRENDLFGVAVTDDIAPGYFEIIDQPVDLGTIRVDINNHRYDSVAKVIADLLQMYANCELYNDAESQLGREAARQRAALKRFCRENHLS